MKSLASSDLIAILALVISIATACLSFYQANSIASSSEESAAIETRRGHLTDLLGKLMVLEADWTAHGAKKALYEIDVLREMQKEKSNELKEDVQAQIADFKTEANLILRRARDLFRVYRFHLSDKNDTKLLVAYERANDEDSTLKFVSEFQLAIQEELENLRNNQK